MMAGNYAYVHICELKQKVIVPVSEIVNFSPKSNTDFVRETVYRCKYPKSISVDEETQCELYEEYECYVLMIGEKVDLQEAILNKRFSVPLAKYSPEQMQLKKKSRILRRNLKTEEEKKKHDMQVQILKAYIENTTEKETTELPESSDEGSDTEDFISHSDKKELLQMKKINSSQKKEISMLLDQIEELQNVLEGCEKNRAELEEMAKYLDLELKKVVEKTTELITAQGKKLDTLFLKVQALGQVKELITAQDKKLDIILLKLQASGEMKGCYPIQSEHLPVDTQADSMIVNVSGSIEENCPSPSFFSSEMDLDLCPTPTVPKKQKTIIIKENCPSPSFFPSGIDLDLHPTPTVSKKQKTIISKENCPSPSFFSSEMDLDLCPTSTVPKKQKTIIIKENSLSPSLSPSEMDPDPQNQKTITSKESSHVLKEKTNEGSNEEEMVDLGKGVYLRKQIWDIISKRHTSARFVGDLAVAIFGSKTLLSSSVTGKQCNRYHRKNANSKPAVLKPALCDNKKQVIREQYRIFSEKQGKKLSEKEIHLEVNRMLARRIQNLK